MEQKKTLQTKESDVRIQPQKSKKYENDLFELSYKVDRHPHNILSYKRLKNTKIKEKFNVNEGREDEKTLGEQDKIDYKQFESIQGYLRDEDLVMIQSKQMILSEKGRKMEEVKSNRWKTLDPKKWKNISHQKLRLRTQSREASHQSSKKVHSLQRQAKGIESIKKGSLNALPTKKLPSQQAPPAIQDQHLMNWLDQVLSDYCFQEPSKDGYKALQRFGLDKSTLLSRGLKIEEIGRLYRSLFSHSLGFQASLKDISRNKATLKSIWKAYAILLQYCSEGYFQTMMGELQRDMIKNEERLMAQIQKRQKIINNNEEIMQKKLSKYQRQNKELKTQNRELVQKKEQLQNDFRQIEMGYNMEVSLRLNYEHKINKVYSVHQRLHLLHQNLFRDFKLTDELNKSISSQSSKTKQKNIEISIAYQQTLKEMEHFKQIIRSNQSMIEGFKMNEKQLEDKISTISEVKREEVYDLKEKQRRVNQLTQQLKSCNLVIDILKSSANSQLQQYKRISQQNVALRILKQQHFEKINQLLAEIIHLNSKESRLKSELQYNEKQNEKIRGEIKAYEQQIEKLKKIIENLQVQIRGRDLEVSTRNKTIQSFEINIKQLKDIYEKAKEESKNQKRYSNEIRIQMEEMRERKMELQILVKNLQQGKFQTELQLNRKINQLRTQAKRHEAESASHQKKYDALHLVWSTQDKSQGSISMQLQKSKKDLQEANTRISFLSQKYTDLTFQKAKIDSLYNNNLILHDNEKKSQKQMIIQVSQFSEKNNDLQRELSMTVKLQSQKERAWQRDKQRMALVIDTLKVKITNKEEYVPAMLLEDALGLYEREKERRIQLMHSIQNEKDEGNEKETALKIEFQKRELDLKGQLIEHEKKAFQIQTHLQKQLQYESHKVVALKSTLQELQLRLKSQRLELQVQTEKKTSERVAVLMKQKNQQIKELYGELQRIQDNFTKKTYEYQTEIKSLKLQNTSVSTLKTQKEELQQKIIKIQNEYLEKIAEKEKEVQEMMNSTKNKFDKGKYSKGDGDMKRGEFAKKLEILTKYYRK